MSPSTLRRIDLSTRQHSGAAPFPLECSGHIVKRQLVSVLKRKPGFTASEAKMNAQAHCRCRAAGWQRPVYLDDDYFRYTLMKPRLQRKIRSSGDISAEIQRSHRQVLAYVGVCSKGGSNKQPNKDEYAAMFESA